jgi:hypothetical protein
MKKTIDTNCMFSNETKTNFTLASLAEMMSRHVTACGVTASADACAHVLSSMASHRLLYVESDGDVDGGVELANAIASFFGCDFPPAVCTEKVTSLSDLIEGKTVTSPLGEKLASFVGCGKICAVVIDNRSGFELSDALSELEGYFSDENETREIAFGKRTLVLPKNTYYIVVMPKGSAKTLLGDDMCCFACPILCERLNTLVTDEEGKRPVSIGAEEFYGLCNEAYLGCQPSEEVWRQIDKIDAFLTARLARGFGNDGYLTMERYFSVFALCTGNAERAIDTFISDFIALLAITASREDREALVSMLSSMSSELKLTKTALAISSLSL